MVRKINKLNVCAIFEFMRLVRFVLFCLLIIGLPCLASAKYVAVLETVCNDSTVMPFQERQFITNVLRAGAVKALPADFGFTIMTRDNINAMLSPDMSIEDCEGSCLVETGRNISADYVAQARVGLYGEKFTLTVELYETISSKLVSSFTGRGVDAEELLGIVESRAHEFFLICRGNEPSPYPLDAPVDESPKPVDESTNIAPPDSAPETVEDSEPKILVPRLYTYAEDSSMVAQKAAQEKASAARKVAPAMAESNVRTTLIVVSAVTTVIGVVGAFFADYYAADAYDEIPDNKYQYRDNLNDIRLAQNLRTVGIIMGAVGAVGLGFSIFF